MHKVILTLALVLVVASVGCSKYDVNLGRVSGKITMDGEPLADAIVTFNPQSGGRPSYGTTDENGEYSLIFGKGEEGAMVGNHMVYINTGRSGDPDQEIEPQKEIVPAKYNTETELTYEVVSGKNKNVDFDLDSKGEIITESDEGS